MHALLAELATLDTELRELERVAKLAADAPKVPRRATPAPMSAEELDDSRRRPDSAQRAAVGGRRARELKRRAGNPAPSPRDAGPPPTSSSTGSPTTDEEEVVDGRGRPRRAQAEDAGSAAQEEAVESAHGLRFFRLPPSAGIVSINPATGEPIGDVPDMSADEVRAAVARARAAQVEWGRVPLAHRCKRVLKFAEVLMERAEEVIDLLVREAGKTRLEALGMEVVLVADLVRYFSEARARDARARADPAAPAASIARATCTSCRAAWSR